MKVYILLFTINGEPKVLAYSSAEGARDAFEFIGDPRGTILTTYLGD